MTTPCGFRDSEAAPDGVGVGCGKGKLRIIAARIDTAAYLGGEVPQRRS